MTEHIPREKADGLRGRLRAQRSQLKLFSITSEPVLPYKRHGCG
jgi:hypothetical protein